MEESYSAPSRPPHMTKVEAPISAAKSTFFRIFLRPKRRISRSLFVNPPSLKMGWVNVLVVTISITKPDWSQASLNFLMMDWRSDSEAEKLNTSLSWKVTPQAPSSASFWAYSQGSKASRVATPNGSTPCQPTVQIPKENLSSLHGLRIICAPLHSWRSLPAILCFIPR